MNKIICLCVCLLTAWVLSSCGGMTDEEKKWIEEQAENGDPACQYKITRMKSDYGDGDYVFGAQLANKYRKSLLDSGYVRSVDDKVFEARDNVKEKVRWLKYGASKGNGKHAHQLGEMYASGDGVDANRELAVHYYAMGDSLGFPLSKLSLIDMEGGQPSVWTLVKSHYDYSYSMFSGSWLGKSCVAVMQTVKELAFSPVSYLKWWHYVLFYVGLFVVAIVIWIMNSRLEDNVATGRSTLWLMPLATAYGAYNTILMDFGQAVRLNIGHLFAVKGTFGDASLFATIPSWIMLIAILYSVYIIVSSTMTGFGMVKRFVLLALSLVFGVFFGAMISILAAIVLVVGMIKGGLFSPASRPANDASGYQAASSCLPFPPKVECPYKMYSGGCNLNNGWSCHVEDGASTCPYGVKEL